MIDAQIQTEEVYPWEPPITWDDLNSNIRSPYTLILTADERQAFDWVGMRYTAGDVANLLFNLVPFDQEWSDPVDIMFSIPEHIAWEIRDLAEEEGYLWPCFSPALVDKLMDLIWRII